MPNAKEITAEQDLTNLLSSLGFVVGSGDPLRIPNKQGLPSCCIFPDANKDLLNPVALTVESASFTIYFYNEMNDWFDKYSVLEGDTSDAALYDTILEASRGATLIK